MIQRWGPPLLRLTVLPLVVAACAGAEDPLEVRSAWARPADAGSNSAAYFVLVNHGGSDILLGASAQAASMTFIHRTVSDDQGVVRMAPQQEVRIAKGANISFEPGGLHVMLMDLNQSLQEGDNLQLTLHFAQYGELAIDVPIQDGP